MKKVAAWATVIFGILVVVAGAFIRHQQLQISGWEARLQNEAEKAKRAGEVHAAQLGELATRADGLERALQAARRQLREAEELLATGRSQTKDGAAAEAATDGAGGAGNPRLALDPDTIKAQVGVARTRLAKRYAGLLQQLHLTPEQKEKFLDGLIAKRQASAAVTSEALQFDDTLLKDTSAFASMVATAVDSAEADIKSTLGDANYAQYQQWEKSAGQSTTVSRLQEQLTNSEPLTTTQSAQLQQLLEANNTGHITVKVLAAAQAQGFLNPAQLRALQDLFQQQQAAQQRRRTPPGG
jgi:hypothetical protein